MARTLASLLAATLIATPAAAANFSARLAAPAAGQKIVARDMVWRCGPEACQSASENSRPVVACQGLAKRAGRLDNFVVDGRAFGSEELAKCNAAAKSTDAPALAKR
jgi:hypothetical protein